MGLTTFFVLLLTCFVGYNTTHYLYPNPTITNKVLSTVLILFPEKYEGIKVAFPMRVEDIQRTGSSIIVSSSTSYGLLNVRCENESLAEGLYHGLNIIVVGVCHIATDGYVDAQFIHPNYNLFLVGIASLFGFLFLIYYTSPLWLSKIKRS